MIYKLLADLTVLIHFLWILFLISGSIAGRRHRWARNLHISGLVLAFFIEIFGWYCPLTHMEVWLRSMHEPSMGYKGGFIIHYMERLIYIELPRSLIVILTILLCLLNLWIYLKGAKRSR